MPSLEAGDLHQKIVIWPQESYDENGRPTLDDAVEINARYETTLEQTVANAVSSINSDSTIVVDRDIEIGTQVRLGSLASISNPIDKLLEVVNFVKVPDLKGRNFRRTIDVIKKHN